MNRAIRSSVVAVFLALQGASPRLASRPTDPRRPDPAVPRFAVAYKGLVSPHPVSIVVALPGEAVDFAIIPATRAFGSRVLATGGTVTRAREGWRWRAPALTGPYQLRIFAGDGSDSITLQAFVLVPARRVRGGYLNGYRIGRYPARPLRGQAVYRPPVGFVEVTPTNEHLYLTPHFQLRQFVTKQEGGYPKYVVLDERLLLKLEYLVERVREAGYATDGFTIMSGYRTPAYNRAIGNVQYSRHVYGAAADVFIDQHPSDGVMDDLNGDGRIDVHDAEVLYDLIDRQRTNPAYRPFIGGLGKYRGTATHGPFVHVDVRGVLARW